MTPAQQVAWIRDVPVSCICEWRWIAVLGANYWHRETARAGCWWHGT